MADESIRLDVKYAIVCDDVRTEDNGKNILIGVYGETILIQKFPVPLSLSFLIIFVPSAVGAVDLQIRLIGPESVEFFNVNIAISIPNMQESSVALKGVPLQFQIPTPLQLQIKQATTEWQTVRSIRVEAYPNTAAKTG